MLRAFSVSSEELESLIKILPARSILDLLIFLGFINTTIYSQKDIYLNIVIFAQFIKA